ncbi:efflux RND transporter periplasmic adaptor subunit [Maricaulis sp. CAU 1757]
MTRLLPLAGLALLAACSQPEPVAEPAPRLVQLADVTGLAEQSRYEFVGRVEARISVDMAFQVGGQLAELPITEGERVEQGALVARLDTEDFDRAVREAGVQLQQARADLERQTTLHERGIASQAALENAQTTYDLRAVALESARRNLEYTALTAPFDGLVSRRLVDNFTIVSPGQPILRIQDTGELRVSVPVSEDMVALFDRTDLISLEAAFPFLPGQTFALEPRELVSEPDSASQTYRALAALPDDIPANILPGMTATVWAEFNRPAATASALRVPLTAVTEAPDGSARVWVFQASEDNPDAGIVRPRAIRLGGSRDRMVIVTDGLSAGEQVVTAGVQALYDGMPVRPLSASTRFGTPQ